MICGFVGIVLKNDEENPIIVKSIVDLENDTLCTTQKFMAELFGKDVTTISKHLKNIFSSKELNKEDVTVNPNDFTGELIINPNSKKQPVLYNIDAIISVGYRVNSPEAIHFRRWAIKVIISYIIKGFALDEESLINNGCLGINYFEELFEKTREIKTFRAL